MQLQLTPSIHNGYNISCFGLRDGAINLTVIGGSAPYSFNWSNSAITEDITGLAAGYYHVSVTCGGVTGPSMTGEAEITLTEPEPLGMEEIIAFVYQNGFNVSAYGACNGSITTNINGGTLPYSYRWEPGQQNTLMPTNLCANENVIIVTDANGCEINQGIGLSEPERDDWTMNGNANSANKFLGTTDNNDLSFRTNNVERFKIKSDGIADFNFDVNIQTAILFKNNKVITFQPAQNNLPDIMSFGTAPNPAPFAIANCSIPQLNTFQFNGTIQLYGYNPGSTLNIMELGFDGYNSIIDATGNSTDPNANNLNINYYCGKDVNICTGTNGGHIQLGGVNSIVGIGTDPNSAVFQTTPYKLIVDGKVGVREVFVKATGGWPDFVFNKNHKLKPFEDVAAYYNKHKHLEGLPSANDIETNGNYNLGEMQQLHLQKTEELYRYVEQLFIEVAQLKKENAQLKKKLNR